MASPGTSDDTARPFKVVIAVDGSAQADTAFRYYMDNLHKAGNEIIAVHAAELPYTPVQPLRGEVVADIMDGVNKHAKQMEKQYKEALRERKIRAVWKSGYGRPGEYITDVANQEEASLIVMGTRGMGTIRRTILGSVSDYVVHHSKCPVVICRH